MKRFEGKVVGITGAANGIGRAIALRFAQEGARVAVTDLVDTGETVSLCKSEGAETLGLNLNVSSPEEITSVVEKIADRWEKIDIWINNAGVFDNTPTLELSEDKWDWMVDINYKSMFLCAKAVLPYMLPQGWGRFVNTSSMAGKMAYPNEIGYLSTKAAVLGLTRSLAMDYGPKGITANAICPGPIDTQMLQKTHQMLADANNMTLAEWDAEVINTIPVGRLGKPSEIASLVAFLSSDEAAFINGQAINIDGGMVFY